MDWSDLSKYAVSLVIACAAVACGGDDGGQSVIPDTTPPGAVNDLTAASVNGTVRLTWTAPGDDGAKGRAAQYDVRCTNAAFDWPTATILTAASPRTAGQPETLAVPGLGDGEWSFALEAADEVPNWSGMSNVASTSLDLPPPPVTDLRIAGLGANSMTLSWTAPGDGGSVGQATEYDLRRSFVKITLLNWASAVRVADVPPPAPAGSAESWMVQGLHSPSGYFFAVRTRDGSGNWSEISNVTSAALGLVRLTTNPSPGSHGAFYCDWSPDGGSIVFSADWYGLMNTEIFTAPAGGGTSLRLTQNTLGDFAPAWSPDRTKIAFSRSPADPRHQYTQIWIMDPTPGATEAKVTNETMNVSSCDWSPDGAFLVYDRFRIIVSPPSSSSEIVVAAANGGNPTTLIDNGSGPRWSPDGSLIAFVSDRGRNYDIWLIPATGGEPVQVTDAPAGDAAPAWSPDGTRLAFLSDRSGNFDIWTVPVGGGEATQVTTDPGLDINPAWSPDGSRILFSSNRSGTNEIWSQQIEP